MLVRKLAQSLVLEKNSRAQSEDNGRREPSCFAYTRRRNGRVYLLLRGTGRGTSPIRAGGTGERTWLSKMALCTCRKHISKMPDG